MRLRDRLLTASAGVALFASAPALAYANAGLPMLAIAWPLSWAALIPIVVIEAVVGRRMAALTWGRALLATAAANIVSTFVGIPLTWGALLAVQFVVPNGGGAALSIDTFLGKVFAVTVQAPWLLPWEADLHWMVPAALLFMLPFFGVVSVYTERPILRWIAKCDKDVARAWSWRANLTTYGIMITAVLVWLVVALVIGK
ncbi:MAG TPA: hypothetical protein VIL17_02205 [Coriobacteriia bacterium]